MEESTEEERFWWFGPTDEPVVSFAHWSFEDVPTDTSGLFGAFNGVVSEETGSTACMVEEGPVRELRLRDRISCGLTSIIYAQAMVAMIHYMWLSFDSSHYARVVSKTTLNIFGGITGVEEGSNLTDGLVTRPWNDGSNGAVNILVDSGASGHCLEDTVVPGLRDKLESYQQESERRQTLDNSWVSFEGTESDCEYAPGKELPVSHPRRSITRSATSSSWSLPI